MAGKKDWNCKLILDLEQWKSLKMTRAIFMEDLGKSKVSGFKKSQEERNWRQ